MESKMLRHTRLYIASAGDWRELKNEQANVEAPGPQVK